MSLEFCKKIKVIIHHAFCITYEKSSTKCLQVLMVQSAVWIPYRIAAHNIQIADISIKNVSVLKKLGFKITWIENLRED